MQALMQMLLSKNNTCKTGANYYTHKIKQEYYLHDMFDEDSSIVGGE